MANILDHYHAVLSDLEVRRTRCQKELAEIDQTISGIRKLLSTSASLFAGTIGPTVPLSSLAMTPNPDEAARKYTGLSVRWAVLKLLAEEANEPLKVTDMARCLVEGGLTSKGKDFAANVAAVVSNMVKERNELEPGDRESTYRLTDNGRLAWAAIKHNPKYVNRASSATVQ